LIRQLQASQDIDEIPTEWNDSYLIINIKENLISGGQFHNVKGHQQLTKENGTRIEVRLNILANKWLMKQ
jgi:hypothetical protein